MTFVPVKLSCKLNKENKPRVRNENKLSKDLAQEVTKLIDWYVPTTFMLKSLFPSVEY